MPSSELACISASVTHNHPEGVRGALTVCDAIFMARFYFGGYHIENEYGYDLSMSLDEIRKNYKLDATCQRSVPQALLRF